jgi:hypothetical protein
MNIVELINEVGIPNIGVQFLDQCATDLRWSEKAGTKITFGSDQTLTHEGTDMLGIVVWLPRDATNAALTKARGR